MNNQTSNLECNPDRMPKDYIRETWTKGLPCPLDVEAEASDYEQSNIYPECNPDRIPKDYIRETWKGELPCPLDAANSKDNDTIKR